MCVFKKKKKGRGGERERKHAVIFSIFHKLIGLKSLHDKFPACKYSAP